MKLLYKISNFYKKKFCFVWNKIFKMQSMDVGKNILLTKFCPISREAKVKVGDYFQSNGIRIMGKGTFCVGNYFHSGSNCKIMLGSHDFDNGECIPYGVSNTTKNIIIGDFVWLGNDVTICGNVKIGSGVIVAMGSVVVKDIPDFAIVGGNPAKILKYRNIDHYNNCLINRKFN